MKSLGVMLPPCVQVLDRVCDKENAAGGLSWIHTKCLYRLSDESRSLLKGVSEKMCGTSDKPQGVSGFRGFPKDRDTGE
jgi:hypothetical protein